MNRHLLKLAQLRINKKPVKFIDGFLNNVV